MTAKMIPVLPITDANFTSSTVPEDDHPVWVIGTTYSLGAKVIKGHLIFESVQASNTGHDPVTDDFTWWVPLQATNRWSVFDGYIQNQTSQAESAQWVVTPAAITTSVSIFNVDGASVTVKVTDPVEGLVYDQTYSLQDETGVFDGWSYCFSSIIMVDNITISDLPPFAAAAISVTVDRAGSTVAVGQITFGYAETLGETANEVSLGIEDYTRLNEDAFGRTSPVIRGYSRTASTMIIVDTSRLPYLERRLADQRGKPTVWTFDSKYGENTLTYLGFYKSFSAIYQYADSTTLDIEIRSLV